MTGRLEIISDVGGVVLPCMTVFSVHISADSCTLNLLYVISKLSCKIDQRELEISVKHLCELYLFMISSVRNCCMSCSPKP